jgi:hypothetical protein
VSGGAALVLSAAAGGWSLYQKYRDVSAVPVVTLARGVFVDQVTLRGDVRPLRTRTVNAPMSASASSDLRIVRMIKNGTAVRKGELIVQFDVTGLQRTLDEKRSELRQAEAEIARLQGETRMKEEQDITDLGKAEYDVERAKLDVSTEELISRVEAEKFKLNLADARRRFAESQTKVEADRRAAAADLDSRRQKRDKAALEVAKAERDLAALTVVAPAGGSVSILNNGRAGGPMSAGREFREGDRAWPGAAIAEVPDLAAVEVVVNVDEADRGRLREDQTATIRVDALPDRELAARVASIGTLAKIVFGGWPPAKQFEMRLHLADPDPRLRSGMSATAVIATDRLEGQLLLPAKAIFQKAGRQVVFARRGLGWDERPVVTGRRNADSVLVSSGIAVGDRVALRDPTQAAGKGGGQ